MTTAKSRIAEPGDVTRMLQAIRDGDAEASSKLAAAVYDQLHQLAYRVGDRTDKDHTLRPTALVHETYIRMVQHHVLEQANDSAHLLALAATTMRRVLLDYARQKRRKKRGGHLPRIPLDAVMAFFHQQRVDPLEIDEVLTQLEQRKPRLARIVEMRFFAGMTMPEIAATLQVSLSTVEAEWRFARAFLRARLKGDWEGAP